MTTPTVHDTLAPARAALAAQLADIGADSVLVALVLQGQHDLTPRECRELDAWLAGRLPDVARIVAPMRRGADSATRAGTLARGQWRGIPALPRGIPGDAIDSPRVSGYLWAICEALARSDAAHAARDRRIGRSESRRKRDAARSCDPMVRRIRARVCAMRDQWAETDATLALLRALLAK